MSIPQDQMAQMQQQFMQAQQGGGQPPEQHPPEDAGVPAYPDQHSLDSPEGQEMMQQAQEPESHSLEDIVQALGNFLYETITNKKLDLKVQTDAVKTLTDSLVALASIGDGQGDEQRAMDLHGLDMEHKAMMNKLEAKAKVDEIGRNGELHNLDISHKNEIHNKNLQQMEQKSEIERVNTHQTLNHNQERHDNDLEQSKRESLEASKKASKSE